MKSAGEGMLAKAMRSKAKRSTKKRGMVAGALGAYTGSINKGTQALQNVGKGIRTGVTSAVNTRVAEQKNFDDQIAAGNKSNYYGTAGTFKRKRKTRTRR